eukprot:15041024-Ditylum_brightwellii.AAC.1
MHINIWAVPKTKLMWTPFISQTFQTEGLKKFGIFKTIGTSSLEGTIGTSQPGGVRLLARGNIVRQISQTGTDNRGLGRRCYFVLNGQYNKRLWVIAGYRVSQMTNAGTTTAFSQQVQLLKMQGIKKKTTTMGYQYANIPQIDSKRGQHLATHQRQQ